MEIGECLLATFENDVKMYGTQTAFPPVRFYIKFENDVKMYGTQTNRKTVSRGRVFENDVKMYGTQTGSLWLVRLSGLRMM